MNTIIKEDVNKHISMLNNLDKKIESLHMKRKDILTAYFSEKLKPFDIPDDAWEICFGYESRDDIMLVLDISIGDDKFNLIADMLFYNNEYLYIGCRMSKIR